MNYLGYNHNGYEIEVYNKQKLLAKKYKLMIRFGQSRELFSGMTKISSDETEVIQVVRIVYQQRENWGEKKTYGHKMMEAIFNINLKVDYALISKLRKRVQN